MAGAAPKTAPSAPSLTDPVGDMVELTTSINRIASNQRDANPYEIRNQIVIDHNKDRVRYEKRKTFLPVSAQVLFANAQRRDYNHRRRLADSIEDAGTQRPANAAAHHGVALGHQRAALSRQRIFDWGIGINDVDKGVFLPRWASKPIANFPNAQVHHPAHSPIYFSSVHARLLTAGDKDSEAGHARLRSVKAQLLVGAFPW